jgi:hypothetical protein
VVGAWVGLFGRKRGLDLLWWGLSEGLNKIEDSAPKTVLVKKQLGIKA